jgi:hypothetical protein
MQMVPIIPALAFLLTFSPSFVVAKEYHYHVWGQLFCNGTPWVDHKIDLYDEDCMSGDDHMGSAQTDKEGRFDLRGSEDDLGTDYPRPYLFVDKTNCSPTSIYKYQSGNEVIFSLIILLSILLCRHATLGLQRKISIFLKVLYFSDRVYLIRKQEEHNIKIYMSADRTHTWFENNGSAYPYCKWKCAGAK